MRGPATSRDNRHATPWLRGIAGQLPRPSVAHLGWACLLAWVFCTFYLHSVSLSLGGRDAASTGGAGSPLIADLAHAGTPLAISVLTLVAIVALEGRIGSLVSRPAVRLACPATTAAGTLLMYVPGLGDPAGEALFWAGALLTGVGSAPLWVMWGELYARLEQGATEMSASLSAVIAALLALLCASLTGWVALVVVALLPVVSGATLSRAAGELERQPSPNQQRSCRSASPKSAATANSALPRTAEPLHPTATPAHVGHRETASDPVRSFIRAFGREGQGILVASAVVCYAGCFVPDSVSLGTVQLALIAGAPLACIIAGVGILTSRHFNLQFLYRWMCPFVLASLACLVWFGPTLGAELSFVGSIGARLAFCLLTQVYFSHVAAEGHMTPVRIFGLGWICLHLGDLLGVALNVTLLHTVPLAAASSGCILALALAMVASVMFTLNGRASFAQAALPDAAPAAKSSLFADGGTGPDGNTATEGIGAMTGTASAGIRPGALAGSSSSGVSPLSAPIQASHAIPTPAPAGPFPAEAGQGAPVAVDAIEARCAELAAAHELTAREQEVLVLLARGRSNPYIRDALTISLDTAGTHVKHVYAKLGVHSRQELIDLVQAAGAPSRV